MTTLIKASTEWMSRPADERFASLLEMHAAVVAHRNAARTATVPFADLHARADNGAVLLNGRTDTTARLNYWAFGQLAQRAGAPAGYLRSLPASLAADCINTGLTTNRDANAAENASLLFRKDPDGGLTTRAILTDRYTRIWNADVTSRLVRLMESGPWQEAPAAFDGSRGQYASAQDMFSFLVDNNRRIFETAPGGGLARGVMVWNSETGAASFNVMTFLYEYVCGNHRVWGASGVQSLRIPHIGNADARAFGQLAGELRKYADSSATETEAKILSARRVLLGNDKDEVLDKVFSLRVAGLSRGRVAEAYALAETRVDWYGDPRSAWGLAGGLTELARDLPFADERVSLDRAAGKIMAVAF